jgi:hypothetical protein
MDQNLNSKKESNGNLLMNKHLKYRLADLVVRAIYAYAVLNGVDDLKDKSKKLFDDLNSDYEEENKKKPKKEDIGPKPTLE